MASPHHYRPSGSHCGGKCLLNPPAIQIQGLVKTFGSFTALDGIDLTVETGEGHGFLGLNATGKSRTIRVLLGLLRANAGPQVSIS